MPLLKIRPKRSLHEKGLKNQMTFRTNYKRFLITDTNPSKKNVNLSSIYFCVLIKNQQTKNNIFSHFINHSRQTATGENSVKQILHDLCFQAQLIRI